MNLSAVSRERHEKLFNQTDNQLHHTEIQRCVIPTIEITDSVLRAPLPSHQDTANLILPFF